jgi:phosphoribosylformimino-5-aminoimidazole carboxamide ribotide isomerase
MLIIPAIDIKDGCVVRYVQGKFQKKVYSRDPLKTARHWVKNGAEFLHIVDLDGAFSGRPQNLSILGDIVKSIAVPVEFGGGLRDIQTVRKVLNLGVSRAILGTMAVTDRAFLKKALKEFKERIIVGIDAKKEGLVINGWKGDSGKKEIFSFARDLKSLGCRQIIYTDTLKDGTLSGPNIKGIKRLLKESGLRIIASGGVSSLEDINKLKCLEKEGISGVIVGKALYEGRFTLAQALKLA